MSSIEIVVNNTKYNVLSSKWQDFWIRVSSGQWEPDTLHVFDQFLTKDTSYIDIGAWIGPTVLYAASLAKVVYAFEPDPLAFNDLSTNVALNPQITNIKIYPCFVGVTRGKVTMGSRDLGGDSMSSTLFASKRTTWLAESIRLEEFVSEEKIHSPIFVKIDIEGGEYSLIPKLQTFFELYRPVVCLSLHPDFLLSSFQGRPRKIPIKIRKIQFRIAVIRLWYALARFPYIYYSRGKRIFWNKELFHIVRNGKLTSTDSIVAMYDPWY
ncbi:hypothetical protein BAC3_02071 [uncultured bacterium]|nr:hypothetical protein BAC3_02071 [uncultured bacterium]